MIERRSSPWLRPLRGGLALALFALLAGDGGVQSSLVGGIDPLEILKLQVKNNVAIVLDTSGSMKWPVDINNFSVGGDDPMSRLYQAKQAVKAVVTANAANQNFGLLSYNVPPTAKPLNDTQDFDDDDADGDVSDLNFADGPFIYVSADANAGVFYNSQTCLTTGTPLDGFFCGMNRTLGNYNGTNDADVFRSFGNRRGVPPPGEPPSNFFSDPYPAGCTPGVDCRYYLQSRLFRNGTQFTWDLTPVDIDSVLTGTTTTTCPLPPVGLTGDNPDNDSDGFSDSPRPCIQFLDVSGNMATFFYTSAIFQLQSGNSCGGALTLTPVPDCVTDSTPAIIDAMAQELPVIDVDHLNGNLTANFAQDYMDQLGSNPPNDNPPFGPGPPAAGVRADQATPIAGSLTFIRTAASPVYPPIPPPVQGIQKNFVIILSDGDDTCADSDPDAAAIIAARQAQALFDPSVEDARHTAETFVIAFASAINIGRSNKIAQAGSGGLVQPDGTVLCPPGATCRNAFAASNTQDLIDALNAALQLSSGTGEFSAAPAILGSVFELGPLTDPLPPTDPNRVDPMNPATRYNSRVNILYQPTFEMPGFAAHLYAFLNDGSFQPVGAANFTGRWDAGETLFEQVSQVLEATPGVGGVLNKFTFAQLHGGQTIRNIANATAPVIKRRIFTSSPANLAAGESPVNRTFTRSGGVLADWDASVAQGNNAVALWPPNQTGLNSGVTDIDPPVLTAGPLDDALGIGAGSNPVLTFADLQGRFHACEDSTDTSVDPALQGALPAGCDFGANPALALETARKEARQILLVWVAGAKVSLSDVDALPLRETATGDLIFEDRAWLMGDSTLAGLAVVGPPLRFTPKEHVAEFLLFRDGRRDLDQQGIDEVDQGFGLRNPDFDDTFPRDPNSPKPVMTVVYLPTNLLLHAFRAGPNCGPAVGQPFDPTLCDEAGSQELWGFVPNDQLGKLQTLLLGQLQDPHTYVLSSSVRVADIFIPDSYTNQNNITFDGRWRTVLFVGRGPGGKFYTALDITAPGSFTDLALDTNPPFVMWNHGNEDPVAGVDPTSDDAYDDMGQSWSVPAVGNVDVAGAGLPEWRAWVGSGYGDLPNEGATFYMLDAETGQVLYAKVLGDGQPTFIAENALVASPSAYNAFQLDDPTVLLRSDDRVTRVYIPDIHGRIWKFNTTSGGFVADEGPTQPLGVPVALMKIDAGQGALPHIFAASGNDRRVPDTSPFKLFGYSDGGAETDLSTPLTPLFAVPLPSPSPGISEGFRGTSQPAAAFNDQGQGRIFFVGTRFNFTTIQCISTFDTILFGLGAVSGNAAYDFNNDGTADISTIVQGVRATNVQTAGGQVLIGDSGALGRPPSPPPPPGSMPSPAPPKSAQVVTQGVSAGSAVCQFQ